MSVRFVSASLTDCGRGLALQVLTDPASLENPEDVVVESHILLLSGKAPHVLLFRHFPVHTIFSGPTVVALRLLTAQLQRVIPVRRHF